jgi:hypothetical protein
MRGLVVTPDDPSRVKQRLGGHCRALAQASVIWPERARLGRLNMTMRRAVIVLAMAAIAAVPASRTDAATRAEAPPWLQALARHDAAALGDANPRTIVYRLADSQATVVLRGRFRCSRSRCPFPLHGRIVSVRGTIATIKVDRHSRRLIAFALTYPLLVVGPASAPPARMKIDFSDAAPGPASAFSWLQRNATLSGSPSEFVIAARARRIATLYFGGHDRVLLVVPTKAGGFCTSLSGPYGGAGCSPLSTPRAHPGVLEPGGTGDASGPILFHGYFTVPNAARLRVIYQDGSTATIPFAWVGKPINAGFFVYDLAAHRRPGHRPTALSLLNSQGKQLYSQRITR